MEILSGYKLPPTTQRIMSTEWEPIQAMVFLEALNQSVKESGGFALLPTDEPIFDSHWELEPGGFRQYLESLIDSGALLRGSIPNVYVISRKWAKHPAFVKYPELYNEYQ